MKNIEYNGNLILKNFLEEVFDERNFYVCIFFKGRLLFNLDGFNRFFDYWYGN